MNRALAWPRTPSPQKNLVDPAALAFAFRFVVIGKFVAFVVAVLVEVDGAVVLAHVDLELAGHAATFPAVVSILHARDERLAFCRSDGVHAVGEAAARTHRGTRRGALSHSGGEPEI